MTFLTTVTEVYRVGSEAEAQKLIAAAKKESLYDLVKYSCDYKEKRSKGEVDDFWYRVSLVKQFTSEKEPDRSVNISYEAERCVEVMEDEEVDYE